ncbi:Checkpoint kinase 2 [Actinomortierella wolfii]|nr:Checkpoint kinase 2 [Actinomortierella wolfii]
MSSGEFRIPAEPKRQRQPTQDASAASSSSNQRQTALPSQTPLSQTQRQPIPEISTTEASFSGDIYSQEYYEGMPVYRHPQRHLLRAGTGRGGGGGGWTGGGDTGFSQQATQPIGGIDATQPAGNCLSYNPEDEEEEEAPQGNPFAFLVGQDGLPDVILYDGDGIELTFGASEDCSVRLPRTKLGVNPTDDKFKKPWFRVIVKQHNKRDNRTKGLCLPSVYVEDLSGFGTYVDGRLVVKPQRVGWGASIQGAATPAFNAFHYIFRDKSSDAPIRIEGERGTYLIGPFLGQGMYSIVREATDDKNSSLKYACKDIDKSSRDFTPVELECIQHEIDILKVLDHENIVKFIDECRDGPHIYIFTEFINGQTLHEYYRQENNFLDEVTARNIIKQVCSALRYLHTNGIVHRDIKSENVMLDVDNKVKLIDFGLARSLSSTAPLKTLCGTYAYMAPECAQGEERNSYSTPVDVWSVGVMLFRMVAGRYPFSDSSDSSDEAAALSPTVEQAKVEHLKFEEAKPADVPEVQEHEDDYKPIPDEHNTDTVNLKSGSEGALLSTIKQKEKVWGRKVDYGVDWMKHVDDINPRTNPLKSILTRFLELDPSKRITMTQALNHPWLRIPDEQLEALEEQNNRRSDSTKADDHVSGTPSDDNGTPWGRLELIPGSINSAPETINLVKEKTYFGRAKGMAGQVFTEDIIGFIVPPDDDGEVNPSLRPRDDNQRFLKYRILINNAPEPTPEQKILRRYESRTDLVMIKSTKHLRLDNKDRIKIEEDRLKALASRSELDSEEWGWLEPLNDFTREERLKRQIVTIGRAPDPKIDRPLAAIGSELTE